MFGGDAFLFEAWRTSIGLKGFNSAMYLFLLIDPTGEVSILSKDKQFFTDAESIIKQPSDAFFTVRFIGAEAA